MPDTLHLQVIGPVIVTGPSGSDLTPHGRKVQAMLAILALGDGEPVARGRLSSLLWENVPDNQARESLRQALHQLRRDLGPYAEHIERVAGRDAVRLRSGAWSIDYQAVMHAGAARLDSVVHGACERMLLEGLDGVAPELDEWLLVQRARFEERLRSILEAEIRDLQRAGAPAFRVLAAAEHFARFDPASEVAARALMLAHIQDGDQSAALRAYQRCEASLRARLDAAPSREIRALADAIRVASGRGGDKSAALVLPPTPTPGHERCALPLGSTAPPADAAGATHSLAPVLGFVPLDHRSSDPDHAVLGELIAEEAIARLSASRMMRVISRLSTSAVKTRERRVDEMGAQLGAHFIVSGGYRVEGSRIHALLELADSRSQEVVWSERVTGAVADLLSPDSGFIETICARITTAMVVAEARKVHRAPLPSAEGFSLLLAGSMLMHRPTAIEFQRSKEVLGHLIERYPTAPEPHAWMAKWHVLQVTRGYVSPRDADPASALAHTRRAMDGSPDCSMALAVEGFIHCHLRGDLDAAESSLGAALAVNPNDSLAWLFQSVVKIFRDDPEEAWRSTRRAIELSPLDPMRHYYDALGSGAALAAKRLPEAIEMATRALQVNNTHLPTLRQLAVAQVESDEIEAARRTAETILRIDPKFNLRDYVARVPKGGEVFRLRCAKALRQAGIPEA